MNATQPATKTRSIYSLTKKEAYLEAGRINAAGGRAHPSYDRDLEQRLGTPIVNNGRRHWLVLVIEEVQTEED